MVPLFSDFNAISYTQTPEFLFSVCSVPRDTSEISTAGIILRSTILVAATACSAKTYSLSFITVDRPNGSSNCLIEFPFWKISGSIVPIEFRCVF